MKINAEFTQRVVVHSANMEWADSPMPGVSRKPLDRVGNEVARATSIVRYAKGSHFSEHVHTGGEEFLVLEGVFQDQHGDYPAGSYVRNPPESSHKPGAEQGCIIFVKLWQFLPSDRKNVVLNTQAMRAVDVESQAGVSLISLHEDDCETVSIYNIDANTKLLLNNQEGIEVLVLDGSMRECDDTLNQYSWLRLPPNSDLNAHTESEGAKIWVKQNHLAVVDAQIDRVNAVNG
jgi:anti-sigma factor ChrR (cupin superfamily)